MLPVPVPGPAASFVAAAAAFVVATADAASGRPRVVLQGHPEQPSLPRRRLHELRQLRPQGSMQEAEE